MSNTKMIYDDAKSIGIDDKSLKQLMNILTPRMQKQLVTSLKDHNISYNFFLNNFYKEVWSFCNKGFFNFKKNFDKFYHI